MHTPKGRILYCEDDFESRELIKFMLEQCGYQVTCVESVTDALRHANQQRFDLFILDNWMPSVTGPELTQQIRQFDEITPILFYSAAAYEDDQQAALNAGAQAYLTKPDGIDHLIDEVDRLVTANKREYSW